MGPNESDDTIGANPTALERSNLFDVLNRQWIVGKDGSLYNYQFFDPRRLSITGLSIYRFDEKAWRLVARSFTRSADYIDKVWQGQGGWQREVTPRGDVKHACRKCT